MATALAAAVAVSGGATAAIAEENLVQNSTMESGVTGWVAGPSPAKLTWAVGGHESGYAARLTNGGSKSATVTTTDTISTVTSTLASATYESALWIRTASPSISMSLEVREIAADGRLIAHSAAPTTLSDTGWHQVAVRHVASGGTALDLTLRANKVPSKRSVLFDDVSLSMSPSVAPATNSAPATPPAGVPLLSGLSWRSGVFVGDQSPAKAAAFAAWRGRPLDTVILWSGRQTWEDILAPHWLYDKWAGSPATKVFGVAMLPEADATATMAGCARGDYNDKWRQFGSNIAARGLASSSIIRLGWEFNGNWYKWSAYDPAVWAECWRQIVTSAESTAPALRWDWNVNRGPGKAVVDARLAYPGDAYVDVVGVDSYDMWPTVLTETEWQTHYAGSYGLKFWYDFARSRGKAFSLPEWGVHSSSYQPGQGGDNPFYMHKMLGFFKQIGSDLAYESYFNLSAHHAGSLYGPIDKPLAAEAYLQRMSVG